MTGEHAGDLCPEYFAAHFRQQVPWPNRPDDFSVITAYATTGQQWSAERNEACDQKLCRELSLLGVWMQRLTGYSPTTGHSEPGWAVQLGFQESCDVGLRYRQDAIYFIRQDTLFVSRCGADRGLVMVGSFAERLHLV